MRNGEWRELYSYFGESDISWFDGRGWPSGRLYFQNGEFYKQNGNLRFVIEFTDPLIQALHVAKFSKGRKP